MSGGIVFDELTGSTLDKMKARKMADIDAIPTPFPAWNAICGEEGGKEGVAKGWVIVIGGVTGTGKSYVALNLAAAAVMAGHTVGEVNFEMSQNQVTTRWLPILTGQPKWKLEMGDHFDADAWDFARREADAIKRETGGSLIVNESNVFGLEDIERSYKILTEAGCSMIVVDYAQLVTVDGTGGIYQRSEAVAMRLRELTHQYQVTTLALSQFNREEAKKDKPPTIHGLLGGGIWEHTSNQIALLNHTVRKKREVDDRIVGEYTEILIRKNRHGLQPVDIPIYWDYETMRWEEYNPGDHDNDPFVEMGSVHEEEDDDEDNDLPF